MLAEASSKKQVSLELLFFQTLVYFALNHIIEFYINFWSVTIWNRTRNQAMQQ